MRQVRRIGRRVEFTQSISGQNFESSDRTLLGMIWTSFMLYVAELKNDNHRDYPHPIGDILQTRCSIQTN